MNELDEIRQRITALEEEPFEQKLEMRITELEKRARARGRNFNDRTIALEESATINDERITGLEEVALILRAKIEPETLKEEAIERAKTIAREREEPEP